MQTTRNGYKVNFDTTKRAKYTEKERLKIVELKRSGLSIRKIAKKMNIPFGSIHYILRSCGEVTLDNTKPSLKYLTRAEAKAQYDLTWSQFDYARSNHKHMTIKVGNVVYLDVAYLNRSYKKGA